jgi:hypothetical protein
MAFHYNSLGRIPFTGDTPRGLKPHSFSRIIVKSLLNFSELHHTLKRRREINLWSTEETHNSVDSEFCSMYAALHHSPQVGGNYYERQVAW